MEISKIKSNAKDYGIPIIRTDSHEFLEKIVKKEKPKRILEIGTAVGYSGITMLKACDDSHLTTIEHKIPLPLFSAVSSASLLSFPHFYLHQL